jgi:hypothetical protein
VKGEGIETKRALDGSNDIVVGATGGETLEQPEFAEVSRRQIFFQKESWLGWHQEQHNPALPVRVGATGAGVRLGVWTGDVASDDAETVNCSSTKSLARVATDFIRNSNGIVVGAILVRQISRYIRLGQSFRNVIEASKSQNVGAFGEKQGDTDNDTGSLLKGNHNTVQVNVASVVVANALLHGT